MPKTVSDSPSAETTKSARRAKPQSRVYSDGQEGYSTLIEFPGTSRAVPEWRKRLSQRVREIQEQKARDAAEAHEAERVARTVSCALPSGQLELVPELEQAPLNPIVSKALERVDRARREYPTGERASAAAAASASSAAASLSVDSRADGQGTVVAKPKLAIVAPAAVEAAKSRLDESKEATTRSVRIISETVEDAALSYLDMCLSVPALSCDTRTDIASLARRTIVGVLDLVVIAAITSPVTILFQMSQKGWADSRTLGLVAAVAAIVTFAYLTISIALSGRTLSMRLLSVKAIDARTGLIPTGGQSIKRAMGYILSLGFFGLGLAAALVDRDHRTLHDRLSKTIVVRT